MEKVQKRKLLTKIYRTIYLLCFALLAVIVYLCLEPVLEILKLNLVSNNLYIASSVIGVFAILSLLFMLIDMHKTKKLHNKHKLALFGYVIFTFTFILVVGSLVFAHFNSDVLAVMLIYRLAIGLVVVLQSLLILNFVIGITLSKLQKSTTVSVDSTSKIPNFDDEIALRKKLNELNRKAEMKKVQEKIENIEKSLDT